MLEIRFHAENPFIPGNEFRRSFARCSTIESRYSELCCFSLPIRENQGLIDSRIAFNWALINLLEPKTSPYPEGKVI